MKQNCIECDGTGLVPAYDFEGRGIGTTTCGSCAGTGYTEQPPITEPQERGGVSLNPFAEIDRLNRELTEAQFILEKERQHNNEAYGLLWLERNQLQQQLTEAKEKLAMTEAELDNQKLHSEEAWALMKQSYETRLAINEAAYDKAYVLLVQSRDQWKAVAEWPCSLLAKLKEMIQSEDVRIQTKDIAFDVAVGAWMTDADKALARFDEVKGRQP